MDKAFKVGVILFMCIALVGCKVNSGNVQENQNTVIADRVVVTAACVETDFKSNQSNAASPKRGVYISELLSDAITKNNAKNVWYRIVVNNPGFRGVSLEEELNYICEIGAKNISKNENSSDVPVQTSSITYFMEATEDMIVEISKRESWKIYLAPPARQIGYSDKISDSLTATLSQLDNNDMLEVAAVLIYDSSNYYALKQNIPINFVYNNELFQEFSRGAGLTYTECDALLEQTVVDILKRNNILEKRVVSDDLPQIGFGEVVYPHAAVLEDIPVGFNAVLTKTEILKLAEDPEIKVIYLAGQ